MRDVDPDVVTALAERRLVARDFIWITAKDWTTGDPVTAGFWSDLGTVIVSVLDGQTGSPVDRTYIGAGSLIKIDDIPLLATIEIRRINVTLSQISADGQSLIRGYNVKQAPVEIHRGLYDPATRALVAPAFPRFLGFVDGSPITTPKAGDKGNITLKLVSHTREFTRINAEKASDASQQIRAPGDGFFKYADIMGNVSIFWGKEKGRIGT